MIEHEGVSQTNSPSSKGRRKTREPSSLDTIPGRGLKERNKTKAPRTRKRMNRIKNRRVEGGVKWEKLDRKTKEQEGESRKENARY